LSRLEILELALVTEKENLQLKSELKEAQPKIEFHDKLIDSAGLYSGSEANIVTREQYISWSEEKGYETFHFCSVCMGVLGLLKILI